MVGCVPPYKPNNKVTNINDNNIVGPQITASQAFDTYKKDTANNFRQLAKECLNGTYEYVSELVDASVQLDKIAKIKRNKPIDSIFAKELGSDKLDKDKAATILNSIADDLDPNGKVTLPLPIKTTAVDTKWYADKVTDFDFNVGAKKLAEATIPKTKKIVYCTQKELMDKCVHINNWSVDGNVYNHLINEHGFTPEQINGLNRHQCNILHSNAHNGTVSPTKVVIE